jgi:DNA polymerase II large subunit
MSNESGISPAMKDYFDSLETSMNECIDIASRARKKGFDPALDVEIPVAADLASRVEKLVGPPGVAEMIREHSLKHNREEVSLLVAQRIAKESTGSKVKALDQAIRTGLAILTEGVLVAPLEGIADTLIGKNSDGTDYVDIYFAGPIRSAGGTGQALAVLIADVVRDALGIGKYIPTIKEVERYKEEFGMYRNLQYRPSNLEIELIAKSCPVCVNGEGTEKDEVTGNRGLPRVPTNQVRGGVCLVIAEGLCLKASKIDKHVKKLDIKGWEFIDNFLKREKKEEEGGEEESEQKMDLEGFHPPPQGSVEPTVKYIKDLIAGRPVFGHPSTPGNFRLRYGRGRTTGLAATAINPSAMYLVDEFLAIGTQIKMERPGKAGAISPCDSIEGPLVLLNNGNFVQVNDVGTAKALKDQVKWIIDLGEILVPYGEFAENNHVLIPGGYSKEWWYQQCLEAGGEETFYPTAKAAVEISRKLDVPLCPDFNLFWHDISPDDIEELASHIASKGEYRSELGIDDKMEEGKEELFPMTHHVMFPKRNYNQELTFDHNDKIKEILIELGAEHFEKDGRIYINRYAYPLLVCLGMNEELERVRKPEEFELDMEWKSKPKSPLEQFQVMKLVEYLAGIKVMPRSPIRIGSRMGRPEKANLRKMKPPVHALFPIGHYGTSQRLLKKAAALGRIEVEVGQRWCQKCECVRHLIKCEGCGEHTLPPKRSKTGSNTKNWKMPLPKIMREAQKELGIESVADVKAVQGLISKDKTPEMLHKGMLRAKNGVFVFKDGTSRFDMTDLTLTHFRPREIGLSLDRAKQLGYKKDIHAKPLESGDQILELKVQDVVVSKKCGEYFVKVARFIDDLLIRVYGLEPFYNITAKEDLIGNLAIGLAPHTSGGVLCRIIGFVNAAVGYGHPFFHAAKRRNCDGDEDALMLLLDGLLNFSRAFIPEKRGGLMDAPLVLSMRIDPNEIDKEAQNIDCLVKYPLEYYSATQEYKGPKDVESIMDTVGGRIGTPGQYEGIMFTHDTSDISEGPLESAYKTLGSMEDKMNAQLNLGTKLRSVDVADVAARVIGTHFLPDLVGNLKSFSRQEVRCTKCDKKYRRIPLAGKCTNMVQSIQGERKCNNHLTMTVSEGSVKKYLSITKGIAAKYKVKAYIQQRVLMTEIAINSLFESDKIKKMRLDDYL